jgi:hypothetical protein
MPILQAGSNQYRFSLQPGESLTIACDANSSCRYGQLASAPTNPDVPSGNMVAVAASSTVTLGQSGASRWLIDLVVNAGVSVTQGFAQSVADMGAPVDVMHLYGSGAPSAATGANQAAIGSLYTDVTNAKLYIQGGTKASPSRKIVTSA